MGTFPIRPVSMIPWLMNWIIFWIESAEFFLNWIIFWIESWAKQYWIEYWMNHFLAKFKNWIEWDWVSNTTISFGCFILSHLSYIEKKNDNCDHRQLPLQGLHVLGAGSSGVQLGKGSCNPLLVFQLEVLWYQDFTGTFINESLHYYNDNVFSRTVSHIPRMCFTEIHVKTNITMKGKKNT